LDVSSSQHLPSAESGPAEIIRRTLKWCELLASPLNEAGQRPVISSDAITGFDLCVLAGFEKNKTGA
jgi:hypothetical protein